MDSRKAVLVLGGSGGGGGGGGVWGAITGTLTDQADLVTALAGKQAASSVLTTYAGINPAANIQSILGAADYAAVRTLLGLVIGTNVQAYNANLTTFAGIAPSANVQSILSAADYAAIRTLLGLVIGTNVQAYDADLTTWAGISPGVNVGTALAVAVGTDGCFVVKGGALGTPTSGNLANCTFPTLNQNTTGTASNLSGTPALPNGVTATTQSAGDNSTKLATTAYADRAAGTSQYQTQSGSYTLVLGDQFKTIQLTSASAHNMTWPQDSDVALPVGTKIAGWTMGAGQTTHQAGTGATVQGRGAALKSAGQYASWMAEKTSANTWTITGDLTT